MKHGVFAVRDRCADAFLPPFCLPTESMAIREFSYAATRLQDHKFYLHPHDYSLYKVAEYDDQDGRVTGLVEPQFLVSAVSLKAPPEEVPPLVAPGVEVSVKRANGGAA